MLEDAARGELELVVIANGCSDDTADRARAAAARLGHDCTVLELAEASKAGALRAGDGAARTFPRVYLDADVVCPTATLRQLVLALERPGTDLAVPQRRLDLSAGTLPARLYYRAWARSPRVREMLAGRGCYALSQAAHQRFGRFPDHVADDRFVTTSVPRTAAAVVDGTVTVRPPGDLPSVLRVRTRVYAGNSQLGRVGHEQGRRRSLAWPSGPREWPSLAVFAAVTALAKLRAAWAVRTGSARWGRDDRRGGTARRDS